MPGALLASPLRRAIAFGVDLAVLIIPSVVIAVMAALLSLSASDPQAVAGMRVLLHRRSLDETAQRQSIQKVLPLLARIEAPGLPPAARADIEEGKIREAADLLKNYDFEFLMQFDESEKPLLKPNTIRIDVRELIPRTFRFLALYGLAAVYFTLFTAGKRGATIGKRLLGIRVVRLDGHRLSWLESLERFVGYLHIPATLGLSLLDFWRDPNRRLPHDRVVHTVVLRVRRTEKELPSAASST